MAEVKGSGAEARRRERRVVAAILVAGWGVSAAVWLRAEPAVEDPEVYEAEHSKRIDRDLERIGGKAAVFTAQLNDAVGSLWEGRSRAWTLAALTAATAGAYVLLRRAAAAHDAG